MTKGKNGQQISAENVALVIAWLEERKERRDWHEYAYNDRINRSVLADELNFSKSVCTQNGTVRALLEAADALWFNSERVEKAAHEAARERAQTQAGRISFDNNALEKRLAELEAENRKLRYELNAYKKQQALVEGGAAGFRL